MQPRSEDVKIQRTLICAAALIAMLPACSAQESVHKTKAAPKPEPTPQDLFQYIRGSLLAYGPDDGINDNLEVTLDATGNVMTVKQPDGHCDQFLNALDANTLVWDVFDASDSQRTREQMLRLTVISVAGKTARTCYDNQNRVDARVPGNRARFLFSLSKTDQMWDFKSKTAKAVKKLITASGGAPEKNLF
jgi:hypothetical protein